MLTIDASALIDALIDRSDRGRTVRNQLRGEQLLAPEIIDLEVVSTLRRLHVAGRVSDIAARTALDDLLRLPLDRVPHRGLVGRVWELRDNAVPYDAAYIATAELTNTALATVDRELAGVPGVRCMVDVLG